MIIDVSYNSERHVKAGELRSTGFAIPADIPDCAYTLRDGIVLEARDVVQNPEDATKVDVHAVATFMEAFWWVEGHVDIEEPAT